MHIIVSDLSHHVHQMWKAIRGHDKETVTQIHHHRWNILQNQTSGIALHFNFPNHNISVQVIDMVPQNSPNSLQKLQSLEHYWISQL